MAGAYCASFLASGTSEAEAPETDTFATTSQRRAIVGAQPLLVAEHQGEQMTDETHAAWRPLGVDDAEDIAEYDALHDGLPAWISAAFWAWVRESLTERRRYRDGSGSVDHLNEGLAESLAQALRVVAPNLRFVGTNSTAGRTQLDSMLTLLQNKSDPLQVADYILAFGSPRRPDVLEELLVRGESAWRVGTRSGRPGLVRRVPEGVQAGADETMARAGRAGVRLAKAWENVYGIDPNPSEGFRLAILAVEDASIPVVSTKNVRATLGTVIAQMSDQNDWDLPLGREHQETPTRDVLIGMMRALWHGQHDRHGGQPSAPGDVSMDEATVAVGLATTLVQLFDAGLVRRAK